MSKGWHSFFYTVAYSGVPEYMLPNNSFDFYKFVVNLEINLPSLFFFQIILAINFYINFRKSLPISVNTNLLGFWVGLDWLISLGRTDILTIQLILEQHRGLGPQSSAQLKIHIQLIVGPPTTWFLQLCSPSVFVVPHPQIQPTRVLCSNVVFTVGKNIRISEQHSSNPCCLTVLRFPIHEHSLSPVFLRSFLIILCSVLYFSV